MNVSEQAATIGTQHGRAAASWVFDGNTTEQTYRAVLAGIKAGDPQVYDMYRAPDLSGEFAGEYGETDLLRDLGIDPDLMAGSWLADDAANAYNDSASEAFWAEVERMARYQPGATS